MTEYTKENHWYGWNGGECPVHPKTIVDFAWFDPCFGKAEVGITKDRRGDSGIAWSQVVKFRITKLHREPREFWITNNDAFAHDSLGEAQKSLHVEKHGYVHVREVLE